MSFYAVSAGNTWRGSPQFQSPVLGPPVFLRIEIGSFWATIGSSTASTWEIGHPTSPTNLVGGAAVARTLPDDWTGTPFTSRAAWPWHTIQLSVRTADYDPATAGFTDDGALEVRVDGEAVYSITGGDRFYFWEQNPTIRVTWYGMSTDFDELWLSRDFSGSNRLVANDGDSFGEFVAGPGNALPSRNTDGGSSGPNYYSHLSTTNTASAGDYLVGTPISMVYAFVVTDVPPTVPGCAETVGTGPNMTGGALRAILVDTGITSPISVTVPVPTEPDATIPQMAPGYAQAIFGGGTITVPTFFYISPVRANRLGPLSNIMDLDEGGSTEARAASVSWYDIEGAADSWVVWMHTDPNFQPFTNPILGSRTITIPGTPHTGSSFAPPPTEDQTPLDFQVIFHSLEAGDAWSPTPGTGTVTTTTFTGWRYLLAGHVLRQVTQVFVRRPVTVIEPPTEPEPPVEGEEPPEPAEPTTTQVEMQVLQQEGTDYVQEIIEVHGNRYHTIRFFASQQNDECTQQYEVTANVEGIETMADGTGTLITDAVWMVKHFLLNWIFNNYRSSVGPHAPTGGRWFTDTPYSPGLIDNYSFEVAHAISAARLQGATPGYQGSGVLTEQIAASQLITDLMRSFGFDFFFNNNVGNGAWGIHLFVPSFIVRDVLPTYAPLYNPDDTILRDSFSIEFDLQHHANVVPYFAGPLTGMEADTSSNSGYSASGEVRDPTSVAYFEEIVADPLYLLWTRHPATAYDVAMRRLQIVRFPPVYARLTAPLGAVTVPLASEIRLTHPDGLGETGWVERICRVVRSDIDLDRTVVNLLLHDIDDLVSIVPPAVVPPLAGPCESGVQVWSDDFETDTPLADYYVSAIGNGKVAGVGVGGSRGLQGYVRTQVPAFGSGNMLVPISTVGCVSFAYKPRSDLLTIDAEVVRVESNIAGLQAQFAVASDGTAAVLKARLADVVGAPQVVLDTTAPGFFVLDEFIMVRLEFKFSTRVGGVAQPDGYARLYRNNVLMAEATALLMLSTHASNSWERVEWMGLSGGMAGYAVYDNVVVRAEGIAP